MSPVPRAHLRGRVSGLARRSTSRSSVADVAAAFEANLREAFREQAACAGGAAAAPSPWTVRLEEIRVPSRLWHGEADGVVPVAMGRHLARAMPSGPSSFPAAGTISCRRPDRALPRGHDVARLAVRVLAERHASLDQARQGSPTEAHVSLGGPSGLCDRAEHDRQQLPAAETGRPAGRTLQTASPAPRRPAGLCAVLCRHVTAHGPAGAKAHSVCRPSAGGRSTDISRGAARVDHDAPGCEPDQVARLHSRSPGAMPSGYRTPAHSTDLSR